MIQISNSKPTQNPPIDPKTHKSESERRSWFLDPDHKLTKIQVWIQFSNYSLTSGNE